MVPATSREVFSGTRSGPNNEEGYAGSLRPLQDQWAEHASAHTVQRRRRAPLGGEWTCGPEVTEGAKNSRPVRPLYIGLSSFLLFYFLVWSTGPKPYLGLRVAPVRHSVSMHRLPTGPAWCHEGSLEGVSGSLILFHPGPYRPCVPALHRPTVHDSPLPIDAACRLW